MKGTAKNTRPNRKVTEFFAIRPKTGPRPDQPVYDISSSSERQSIISISSDDVPLPTSTSQPRAAASTRVPIAVPKSPHGTRSKARYVSSSPYPPTTRSTVEYVQSSSSGTSTSRSQEVQIMPNPPPKKPAPASSMSKNHVKKRKQPLINLITSEESDDPVLPAIHVKPSSRKTQPPLPSPHSRATVQNGSTSPVLLPLTPRQNLLSASKSSPRKSSATVLSTNPRDGSHPLPQRHRPPPPKRSRHDSFSASDKRPSSVPDDDADDESENEASAPPRRNSPAMSDNHERCVDDALMDVDSGAASSSRAVPDDDANDDDSEGGIEAQSRWPSWNTTPREDAQEILPSSQQDEIELSMDVDEVIRHVTQPLEDLVSPSKSRADAIIARIKAKAEAEAAVAAQELDKRRRSLALLGSEDGGSDLSSLPSLSEDDDDELELDLGAYGKNAPSATDSGPHTRSQTPDEGIRRSTRHGDAPAPNYAKRLELFRDDTPPPSDQKGKERVDKGKGKAKAAPACPLDVLLKANEREDARKAKAETKRKAPYTSGVRDSSPPASARDVDRHSGIFETPKRHRRNAETESPGSDVSSVPDADVPAKDVLMNDAEREELLGKEGAEAVGKILEGDREKRSKGEKKPEGGVVFWDVNVERGEDVLSELIVKESDPVLSSLRDVTNRGDHSTVSLLLNSGILAAVPRTLPLVEWLFSTALCVAAPMLSKPAYRALLLLHHTPSVSSVQLTAATLLSGLFKFGVDSKVVQLLGVGAPVVGVSREIKIEMVCRFVAMVQALGRSQAIESAAAPSLISALLLLALAPFAAPELQQDVVSAIESLLASPTITRAVELDVCKSIVRTTTLLSFTPEHEARLLTLLQGCSPSAGRVRRWTAWAMLGGALENVQGCEDVPPLHVLAKLFAKEGGGMRLEVTRDTDYEILGARVDILSVAMTDVDAYVRGAKSGGLENIYKALESMNGKIVDTRAAHLDRTRAKDAINRLHKRLVYQRHAILEIIRGNAGKMDGFVTKTKGRPKPVRTQPGGQ